MAGHLSLAAGPYVRRRSPSLATVRQLCCSADEAGRDDRLDLQRSAALHAQYQPIIERFHADETFRQAVLADANGAVRQEFGIDLPGRMQVVAEGTGYRVEPVVDANGDLSDEQLELVSGGKPSTPAPSPSLRSGGIISNNGANIISNNGANYRY